MILEAMCRDLAQLPERVWAAYALSREPLRGKFTPDSYLPYYDRAKQCGYDRAEAVLAAEGTASGQELAQRWGVEIRQKPMPYGGGIVTFACYYEDSHIELFRDNAEATMDLLETAGLSELFGHTDIVQMLLAHELFHFLQGKEPTLYVNQARIVLWKLLGYERRSRILSLEEVASMAFAQRLLGMNVNPYVFDVLMLLPRFPEQAGELYRTIMTLQEEVTANERAHLR